MAFDLMRPRNLKGEFAPGGPPPRRPGRPKGSKNKFPKSVRAKVIEGFNDPNDETGNGIVDFVRELKKEYPPAAAGLLARILPTVNTEDGGCSGSNVVVNICSIPSGKFLTDAPVALQKEAKLHLVADNVFELDEDGELIVDADNVVDLRPAPVADAADTFDVDHIENDADGDKDGARLTLPQGSSQNPAMPGTVACCAAPFHLAGVH